jgi:hypothetical protein
MYRALTVTGLAVTALASCSGGHATQPGAAPAHHVASAPTEAAGGSLAVRRSTAHLGVARRLRDHGAIVLSPDSVEFAMGGSSSCPPVARTASRAHGTLVIPITSPHRGCTADLVFYTVVVTLNQPTLSDTTIVTLRTGYGQAKARMPLLRV